MKKIVYYSVATGGDTRELGKNVMQMFNSGFQPLGGPAVTKDGQLIQAMVQYEESPKAG